MDKKTLKDVDVKGKKVFVRVDYNVPFDEKQNITNDTRMVRTLPTINYLLDHGAAVILACHIGRPTEAREPQFSTKHLVKHLGELLKKDVKWASDCVGEEAEKLAADLKPGKYCCLRISGIIRRRRRMIRNLQNSWHPWLTWLLTMHLVFPTVHMHLMLAFRNISSVWLVS